MITNSGVPRGLHMGFVHEEEEEAVIGEEYCDSDSDDDVDLYVFLARQPAPAEAEASDSDDVDEDDGDAMPGGGGGGCRGWKRHLREILEGPPSAKKARLDLTAPLAPAGTSGSEAASSPCSARTGESGSVEAVRFPEGEGDHRAKNKKRGRCGGDPQVQRAVRGKRGRGPDCDAGEGSHRDETAATAAAAEGASRRFLCSICGRCFGSHQALGGHVLGHRKKAKKGIAAASHEDAAGGNRYCDEKMASQAEVANGTGRCEEKAVVAAHGRANGEGNCDGKKTLDVAACHEDVDSSDHGHGKAQKSSVVASNHNHKGFHGNGNKSDDDVISTSHERTNGNGHNYNGDGDVEEEKVAVAPRHGNADANGTDKKVAVRRCHSKLATGNVNSVVLKTQHRCEVCGKECPTGQALGGHMRKHRTRPAHGGEGRSARPAPEADGPGYPATSRAVDRRRDLLGESRDMGLVHTF